MLVKNSNPPLGIISDGIDRINDVTGKEIAISKSGLKRQLAYQRLNEGLSAVRVIEEISADGDPKTIEVPDMLVRHKYVETALKIFGDLKDKQEIEMSHKMENSDRELLMKYGVIKAADSKK